MITTEVKNKVLNRLATLIGLKEEELLSANRLDVASYSGSDESMLDRLKVDKKKVDGMIESIKEAVNLSDPEAKVMYTFSHENGMKVENRTVPFGTILIIYESRPDVTIEAAITAFKAGNKILLKGGKEARNSNLALVDLWHQALHENHISTQYVTYLDLPRKETQELIKNNTHNVDLIIPRGGEGLINFVHDNTDIPTIVSGRGNNFLYVDSDADFKMASEIILDGKKRISVCNALDKVLIHKELPQYKEQVSLLIKKLQEEAVKVVGDESIAKEYKIPIANDDVLFEEFLSAKIMLSATATVNEAINKINKYSGGHSATIVTSNTQNAELFLNNVDCAAVYHNASTRFTDGGQFGFGAEMAISTQKVHFRGPIGIDQLVTNKWFIYGSGQVRR